MTDSVTLVTNQVDKVGGLERYVNELATRLIPRGFDVAIVAKRATPGPREIENRDDGVSVVRTWVPSKDRFWFAPAYALGIPYVTHRAIKSLGNGRVLHGHFFAPMIGPALQRNDYIYTCHGPMFKELLDERQDSYVLPTRTHRLAVELTRRAERQVITNARLVTVLSEFMAAEVQELVGRPQPVAVLPGGVDTARFSPGRSVRPSWAEGRFPLLLSTRRLATGKGVLEVVQAMPDILRGHPEAMLVVAGSGGEENMIRDQVEALGVREAVRLLGDVGGDELVNWVRGVDLCVVPTQRPEPFGLSTVEALACATPVVATPSGASRALLDPLDPRLVLPGSRPNEMARGISDVAADVQLMQEVRAKARAHVHPRFSWDQVADCWAAIYRNSGPIVTGVGSSGL